jgi:hypothetical protein
MTKARSNAVANAAKGDLTVGNGTNLSGILAVGSNGDTLVADSSTSTGLRYTAGNPIPNPILNSSMQVWQRGTASTAIGTTGTPFFLADRWQAVRGGFAAGGSVSRQLTGDTTNLPFIQYCQRVQRDSGNTSTAALILGQNFESINSIPFAGKTVTVSFYARAGANYSSASSLLRCALLGGTGTDQNGITSSYTGSTFVLDQNATLTTTWQRFSFTGSVGATVTELSLQFISTPTGTAGAADFFEVTGVQIDIGSVALPFRTYAGTIQGELAACQRYYWRVTPGGIDNRFLAQLGATGTTQTYGSINNPVSMRVHPTSVDWSALNLVNAQATNFAVTTLALQTTLGTINNSGMSAFAASGLVVNQWYTLNTQSSSAYIGFSAEL